MVKEGAFQNQPLALQSGAAPPVACDWGWDARSSSRGARGPGNWEVLDSDRNTLGSPLIFFSTDKTLQATLILK